MIPEWINLNPQPGLPAMIVLVGTILFFVWREAFVYPKNIRRARSEGFSSGIAAGSIMSMTSRLVPDLLKKLRSKKK